MIKRKRCGAKVITYCVLIILFFICVIPFYLLIIGSTYDNATLASRMPMLPGKYFIENYLKMAGTIHIWRGFFNSLIVAGISTAANIYIGSLTAFGFSKYRFRWNKQLFVILLCCMMIPPRLGIIGYYQLMSEMKTLNSLPALIFPALVATTTTFWEKQYMDAYLPDALIECARIDGCNDFKIFHRIALPLVAPASATMAIFTFVETWNNFEYPLILLTSSEKFTLPLMVQTMQGVYARDYGAIYMGVTFSVIPILLIFVFCSKQIVGGLTVGAIKE